MCAAVAVLAAGMAYHIYDRNQGGNGISFPNVQVETQSLDRISSSSHLQYGENWQCQGVAHTNGERYRVAARVRRHDNGLVWVIQEGPLMWTSLNHDRPNTQGWFEITPGSCRQL